MIFKRPFETSLNYVTICKVKNKDIKKLESCLVKIKCNFFYLFLIRYHIDHS